MGCFPRKQLIWKNSREKKTGKKRKKLLVNRFGKKNDRNITTGSEERRQSRVTRTQNFKNELKTGQRVNRGTVPVDIRAGEEVTVSGEAGGTGKGARWLAARANWHPVHATGEAGKSAHGHAKHVRGPRRQGKVFVTSEV